MVSMELPLLPKRLEGKVAILTGGAGGIGEATARLFVEHGALVVIAGMHDDKGIALANELGLHVAAFKHCDVTLESDVEALVAFAVTKWGTLDIMFNNAGISGKTVREDMRNLDMAEFDYVMSVNVRGVALGIKHASKVMVDNGTKGVILCTGSIASVLGGLASVMYTVSKHAILGLVHAASSDLGKYGIRVNCISPYAVLTPLLLHYLRTGFGDPNISPEAAAAFGDSHANLKYHTLSALDVARSALFLASEDAAYVSGLNLLVDGGFTACSHAFDN